MKLAIFDDVLEQEAFEKLSGFFSTESSSGFWIPAEKLPPIFYPIVRNTASFLDISKATGFEFWTHYNTRSGWHVDQDENRFKLIKKSFPPLASIVFYGKIDKLIGGELYMEDGAKITPKQNRQVTFSQKEKHYVENFRGTRLSILLNPWEKPPTLVETMPQELIEKLWALSPSENNSASSSLAQPSDD
jgi:hypothetical protein